MKLIIGVGCKVITTKLREIYVRVRVAKWIEHLYNGNQSLTRWRYLLGCASVSSVQEFHYDEIIQEIIRSSFYQLINARRWRAVTLSCFCFISEPRIVRTKLQWSRLDVLSTFLHPRQLAALNIIIKMFPSVLPRYEAGKLIPIIINASFLLPQIIWFF